MDLSAGRRVGYDIDSLLGSPSSSNFGTDDNRRPVNRDRNYSATTITPGTSTVQSDADDFTLRRSRTT